MQTHQINAATGQRLTPTWQSWQECRAVAVMSFGEPSGHQIATIVLPTDNTPRQALSETCPRIHLPLSTAAATAEPAATTGWLHAMRRVPCATPRPSSAQAAAVNSPIYRTGGRADRRHNPLLRPHSSAWAGALRLTTTPLCLVAIVAVFFFLFVPPLLHAQLL